MPPNDPPAGGAPPNPPTPPSGSPPTPGAGGAGDDKKEIQIPKARFDEVNNELRTLKERIAKEDKEREEAAAKKLAEDGKFKEVADAASKKATDLEKALAGEKELADKYRGLRTARVEALKKALGDAWLPEYENFSLESLDKLAAQKDPPKGVNTQRPAGGGASKPVSEMTPQEFQKYLEDVKSGRIKAAQ